MTSDALKKQETARDLDPNVRQNSASDPAAHVWVGASAGTGKTKVLTDRMLRLLLPRTNGAPGAKPHKILGLTFTRAAAGEMALRLNKTLSAWAVMKEENLREELKNLLGGAPDPLHIDTARKLFAQVVDVPGGLKIMTIHAFCQSVLGRFPLEANLPPYFTALEENEAQELLRAASATVISRAQKEHASPGGQAFAHIAGTLGEDQFFMLLGDIASERRQLQTLLEKQFGPEGIYARLCADMNLRPGQSAEDILRAGCADEALDAPALRRACESLTASKSNKDTERGEKIAAFLAQAPNARVPFYTAYKSAFLTGKGEIAKTLATKDAQKIQPDILDILEPEAQRLLALEEKIKAATCATLTRSLLALGSEILDEYAARKHARAALDFDDLILKTRDLLKKDMKRAAGWVLYKLDQGIDHILVDEAQDTNPDQWTIIEALCDEFIDGAQNDKTGDTERTLFIVGDEKQSIYSFQRASPHEFDRMREHFAARLQVVQQSLRPVDLNISFRSSSSILQAVDAVFADPARRTGLSRRDIAHHSFRVGQEGLVELWPMFESDMTEESDPWAPPVNIKTAASGAVKLADHIAAQIENWIGKETLPARGRTVQPGDIMILVRTRGALVHNLMRALKNKNIPVSGADRMVLGEQLVVEDLLALAEFCLLPGDDLALACVLKSPLAGLDEDALYEIAANRTGSLWNSLRHMPEHKNVVAWLSVLIALSRRAHPYEFFGHVLQTPCPADPRSGLRAFKSRLGEEIIDPVGELLSAALAFERHHAPSLQHFTHWQRAQNTQIKREMEESGGMVRIMTVHGSKGLQAPIVILPDTTRTTKNPPGKIDRRLIWPDKSELETPIFAPRADAEPALFRRALETLDERMEEEYRRLLYVAMTRAEDRLYIGGCKGKKDAIADSWYHYIRAGLESLPEIEHLENGALRLHNPQVRDPDRAGKTSAAAQEQIPLPGWAFSPAPAEPSPPRPLMPSRPSESLPPARSPLGEPQDQNRFRRGNLVHRLLELLPATAPAQRQAAARTFLQKQAGDLEESTRETLLQGVFAVLDHPEFAPLFGENARAEVPITALTQEGKIISGRIDRLLVTQDEVLIVDYKSGAAPANEASIPPAYRAQLESYAAALRAIYPRHNIRAALLWTDALRLMPVELKPL